MALASPGLPVAVSAAAQSPAASRADVARPLRTMAGLYGPAAFARAETPYAGQTVDMANRPTTLAPLVVETDRAKINSTYGFVLAVHLGLTALVIALMIWAVDVAGGASGIPFAIVLAGELFQLCYWCYLWGVRISTPRPLVLATEGVTLQTRHGEVSLPWPAVAGVTRHRRLGAHFLALHLASDVSSATPGVNGPADPRFWQTAQRQGLRIGGLGIRPDLDTVVAAFPSLSAGRLHVE